MSIAHVEHNLSFPSPFQTFTFLNSKCESAHLMRRNPRKVTWTVLYRYKYFLLCSKRIIFHAFVKFNIFLRRKHKKGQEEEQTKKRTRRAQKFQRAIVGASLTDILAKRNMKPEIRKAQREQAIKYVSFYYNYLFNCR